MRNTPSGMKLCSFSLVLIKAGSFTTFSKPFFRRFSAMKSDNTNAGSFAHVPAYFTKHWDGLHGYHYTPPAKEIGYSAMAMSENVCQISFKVFEAYGQFFSPFHRNLIKYALDQFIAKPSIKAPEMPVSSRVTTTETDDYKLLHVKVTYPENNGRWGLIDNHNVLPAGYSVSVKGEYRNVKLLPSETPVKYKYENGYTTITLPEIKGYSMFLLEK